MDNRYTLTRAGELSDELISIRRKIHQNPEIGFDLPKTTALVAEKLKAYGIEFKKIGKAGSAPRLRNTSQSHSLRQKDDSSAELLRIAAACEAAVPKLKIGRYFCENF